MSLTDAASLALSFAIPVRRPTMPLTMPLMVMIGLCLLLPNCASQATVAIPKEGVQSADSLISEFGSSSSSSSSGLTDVQLRSLVVKATGHSLEYVSQIIGPCDDQYTDSEGNKLNCTFDAQCATSESIFQTFGVDNGQRLERDGLLGALPVVLDSLTNPACLDKFKGVEEPETKKKRGRPTITESWLYGLGFSSLVAIVISNTGAILGPCMESKFFRRLIQFLVSMGAGSLATTGLLVLIPEAFELVSVKELGDAYIWKATVAILSIFTFFSSERLLKTFLVSRNKKKQANSSQLDDENRMFSMTEERHIEHVGGSGDASVEVVVKGHNGHGQGQGQSQGHGHSHLTSGQSKEDRLTMAWMVMGGDILHNFVDGLSIGAAFTDDLSLGISVSLAIICEELPHELSDIAILLHSGIKIKRAILINFFSACAVYVGLVLGILIGSNIHAANLWIFAMAGGLFLYIPLVDMLPDMRAHLDLLLAEKSPEARTVAVLHLVGLLVGTGIIVFIVNISGYINVE